jgi:hypothetical protein
MEMMHHAHWPKDIDIKHTLHGRHVSVNGGHSVCNSSDTSSDLNDETSGGLMRTRSSLGYGGVRR